MNARTPLSELPDRRAPNLHRTLPTWARQAQDDGQVEYRLYAPHAAGGALFSSERFPADADRTYVARRLRSMRAMIWGRDKLMSPEEAERKRAARARRLEVDRAARAAAPATTTATPMTEPAPAATGLTSPEQQAGAAATPSPTQDAQADTPPGAAPTQVAQADEPAIREDQAAALPAELTQTVGDAEALEQDLPKEEEQTPPPESVATATTGDASPLQAQSPAPAGDTEQEPAPAASARAFADPGAQQSLF
ncbi:MAG: hypothetical protein A2580_11720 [Hydrogenophilales bacterium RIFOXYD1_FULL_62_11]|nr:MAG: hypothetical protein A2580_11720 [Hydrogenophilales bacterium RIFOXYD1_FULL_62_11]